MGHPYRTRHQDTDKPAKKATAPKKQTPAKTTPKPRSLFKRG